MLPLTGILKPLTRWTPVQAVLLGLLATGLVWVSWIASPSLLTSLDWSLYDNWGRLRGPIPVSSEIVLVTRDDATLARSGVGEWDRARVARVIQALDRVGVSALGIDVSLDGPSPPERGGATSDVLLVDALRAAGSVVLQVPRQHLVEGSQPTLLISAGTPTTTKSHGTYGHRLVIPDEDGVVRRIPLYVPYRDGLMPAYGLALAEKFLARGAATAEGRAGQMAGGRRAGSWSEVSSHPADGRGSMLVNFAGTSSGAPFATVPFSRLWTAIERGDAEFLRQRLKDRVVVFVPDPGYPPHRTALSSRTTDTAIHVNVLNTILTGQRLWEIPLVLVFAMTLAAGTVGAWLLLSWPGWRGPVAIGSLAIAYGGIVFWGLASWGIVAPLFTPLWALVLGSGTAILWTHLTASAQVDALKDQIRSVQEKLETVRETLAVQESTVEILEEDLETARSALALSEGKEADLVRTSEALQGQCAEARTREEGTRQRAQELERQLESLRSVGSEVGGFGDSKHERLRDECERLGILTKDPGMLALFTELKKAARSSLNVLILGEPGTGKELFARALHRLSSRAERPFIAVNMAAISPELFESELFGHAKGSFTGAVGNRKGYFEVAHQGTLFLDEIGELQYEHQAKLLRVLQERMFFRVGAAEPIKVDVRVVAATNKNLARTVSDGLFRDDLYYRLKGFVLRLAPLRERRADLPILAKQFVRQAALEAGREGLTLSREALAVLEAQPWLGNVRELQQCLCQAVALAEGKVITKEDLRMHPEDRPYAPENPTEPALTWDPRGDQAVLACLVDHEFDMQATAQALGWDRTTVTQRLKGLGFRALVDSRGDLARAALSLSGDPTLAKRLEAKLREYHEHLLQIVQPYQTAGAAIAACRKRLKNLPDRHFKSVELLIHQYFDRSMRRHDFGRL